MSTTEEETWEEAWDAEIRRRSEEVRSGQVRLVPFEEVKRQARELLARRRRERELATE